MNLVFLHGLETGPHGSKYHALRAVYPALQAPDCHGIGHAPARLAIVEKALDGQRDLVLVGSSFGGLVAVLFADRHPDRVRAYVLCAPALDAHRTASVTRVPPHAVILHGTRDATVQIDWSRDFSRRFGIPLVEVDDDHRLEASKPALLDLVAQAMKQQA